MSRTHDWLAAFTRGYAFTMLDANTRNVDVAGVPDDTDVPASWWQTPGADWQLEAFDAESRASIESECRDFFAANLRDLIAYAAWPTRWERLGHSAWEQAGSDFALSRNGHGAGYFDRGMGELGDRLQDAARVYGESNAWTTEDDSEAHLY